MFKKSLSLFLAVFMLLSVFTPAIFAYDPDFEADSGDTISVEDASDGVDTDTIESDITGKVSDAYSHRPLEATVKFKSTDGDTSFETVADYNGDFEFKNVPEGEYTITIDCTHF